MTQTSQSSATGQAPKIRASELVGETWFNTGGEEISLADLRGKIVILDFWTFCCVNCLHVLDELRPLEEKYHDVLVTVGVHSPKFDYEGETEAVAAAVERYDITHPVLNDPQLTTWQAYTARAWPTLVVVDPEGYIVAHLSGEGQVAGLFPFIESLVEEHEAKGTLHRGDGPYVAPEPIARDLKFPGKAIALGARGTRPGTFLVSDTGHHRLVEIESDLSTVVATIGGNGTGSPISDHDAETNPALISVRGHADGGPEEALFNEPHGTVLLPENIAAQVGYDIVVADSVNHRLRGVNLATGHVTTIAGNGVQRLIDSERAKDGSTDEADSIQLGDFPTAPLDTSLSTPWDVTWSTRDEKVIIAMAGTHQIFDFDPVNNTLGIWAGTGLEGLQDGPASTAWFAQPSGLVEDAKGLIWVADSETSAIRWMKPGNPDTTDDTARTVGSVIGEGLFDFGFRDGEPSQARLQHPLGITALPDGSVLIADTYNHAIRRYAPAHQAADGTTVSAEVSTVARDLLEPSDVLVETDENGIAQSIVVVETNAHQLVRLAVPEEFLTVDEGESRTQRPPTHIMAGNFPLTVAFSAPEGQKLDDRWGDPTQLKISSSPEELLLSGAGTETGLQRELVINPEITDGVLHITARAAACDGAPGEEIPLAAACHLYQQDWGIPVQIHTSAAGDSAKQVVADHLDLDLRGIH